LASSSVYKFKYGLPINYLVPNSGGNLVFLYTAWLIEKEYSDTEAMDTLSFSPSSSLIYIFFNPVDRAYFIKSNLERDYGFAAYGGGRSSFFILY